MREIKFRGKRPDNGEWIVGSYIEAELRDGSIAHQIVPYKSGGVVQEVDPATVGQYIGLQDRGRKDYYEDDLLRTPEGDIMQVIWNGCGFITKCVKPKHKGMINTNNHAFRMSNIIGNIHDNPELLKGGKQ